MSTFDKYLKYKRKYLNLLKQIAGAMKYNQLVMEMDTRSNMYWNYYINMDIVFQKANDDKYKKIYTETQNKLQDKTLDVFEKFATAWLADEDNGETISGPDFTLSVCEYFDTCQQTVVPDDWFMEAAVRDMLLDIIAKQNTGVFKRLEITLKDNKVI